MTTELEAAIARLEYVARDEEIPPGLAAGAKLSEDVAAVLAVLSTPPADDVREALAVDAVARAIFSGYVGETPGGFDKQTYAYDREKAKHVAHRALAAASEVRLRGTVTDAEPTETQILAGLNAELPASKAAPSLDYYDSGSIARMRNVLRAAAGEARS